jgi:hypothetical protein
LGLSVEVGYLADMLENDEDGAQWFRESMSRLNGFLVSQGLQAHREPEACPVSSYDMCGYHGVHYLRRIAVHLDLRGSLPPPGNDDASEDAVLENYLKLAEGPGLLGRFLRRPSKPRTFDHLILHSDAEGYYLPQDFASVVSPPASLKIPGGMVGSSYRLREECRRLATALKIDLGEDHDLEANWEAIKAQLEEANERYAVESLICVNLHQACEHSIRHGAAIVFC